MSLIILRASNFYGDLEAEYGTSIQLRTLTSKYYSGKRTYVMGKSFNT
jgi:hypothetical protein